MPLKSPPQHLCRTKAVKQLSHPHVYLCFRYLRQIEQEFISSQPADHGILHALCEHLSYQSEGTIPALCP